MKCWKGSEKAEKLIVCLYVDDLLITDNNENAINMFKGQMMNEFEMSDLGLLNYFLGIEFKVTQYGTMMHQSKYAKNLLKRFNMQQSNPVGTPVDVRLVLKNHIDEDLVDPTYYRKIIGCLRCLCNTRLDLSFSVRLISRFMQGSKQSHLLVAQGTVDFGILFPKGEIDVKLELVGYSDSDWCGDKCDR